MPEAVAQEVAQPLVEAILRNNVLEEDPLVEFDDDDEDDFEEEEQDNAIRDWNDRAIHAIENGGRIPNAPIEGPLMVHAAGQDWLWDNAVGLEPLGAPQAFLNPIPPLNQIVNDPAPQPVQRPRRGNRAILEEGRHMPAGINPPPIRKAAPPPPKYRPFGVKVKEYPLFGVRYNGYLFSRELDMNEKVLLGAYGYHELLKQVPDLVFKEKDIPIDENEECVILLAELADHLAIQACKQFIPEFDIETHCTEYQAVYKRYLKEISSFKRTKNG